MDSGKTNSYEDLTVWQLAMDLAEGCYRIVRQFPSVDRYGLEAQLLESAIDLPALIADAYNKSSPAGFIGNINDALASLARLETQVLVAERLMYCNAGQRMDMLKKMQSIKWLLVQLRKAFRKPANRNSSETTGI